MSQVKKFQNGSGKEGITPISNATQSKKYKIKVDGRDFDVDEDALDTHFDNAFNELVQKGYAKEGDRSQWYDKFKGFKDNLNEGAEIDMTGEHIGELMLPKTLSQEQLGLTPEGTTAKSSRFGRFIKGGVKDPAQMNALLHGMIGQSIGQSAGLARKEFETKAKEDEEIAKTKRKEEVDKILSKLDPSKRGFGTSYFGEQEGSDKDFALKYFWGKDKSDVDRNYMYGKAIANFGKELFSDKYKDKDVLEAAKEKGIDIESMKAAFTSKGFDPNKTESFAQAYKTKGRKSFEDFHNLLDVLKTDSEYFDKDAYEALKARSIQQQQGSQTTDGTQVVDATGGAVETTLYPDKEQPQQKTGWTMENGVLTRDGKPFSGFRFHSPFSSSNAWYVEGRPVSKETAGEYVKKKPELSSQFSSGYQDALNKHAEFISKYGFTRLEKDPGKYRSATFAFNDLLKESGDAYGKDASADFTGLDRDNSKLFEYIVFKGPKSSPTPIKKFRYYDKNKNQYRDGSIHKDPLTGNFTFRSDDGKFNVNIGNAKTVADEDISKTRSNLYFNYSRPSGSSRLTPEELEKLKKGRGFAASLYKKEGGVIKYQQGGDLQQALSKVKSATKQRTTATTSDVMHMNLSDADKWKLGGLAADLGGLVASFTGAGSVAGAGLGIGGSAASFVGDIKEGRDTGDALKDLGVNVGLDVLSAVPVLGLSAKMPKVAKALKASKNLLNAYFITQGLTGAVQSLKKIDDPSNMTIDDWRNITGGIQAILSGKRALDTKVATTKVKSNTIKANGKTIEITPEQAAKIKETKGREAKTETAKSIAAEQLGIKPEEVNVELTSAGLKLNKTINPLKMVSRGKQPEVVTSSDRQLKDVDEYTGSGITNWYMRNAIRNTAYLNPMLAGSDKLLAPRFKKNEKGEYTQVFEGSSGGPGWLGARRNTYISKEGDVSSIPTGKTTVEKPATTEVKSSKEYEKTVPTPEPKVQKQKTTYKSKYEGLKKSPVSKPKATYAKGGVLFALEGTKLPFYKRIIPGITSFFTSGENSKISKPNNSTITSFKLKSKPILSKPKIELNYEKYKPTYSLSKEQTPVKIDYMPEQTALNKEFGEKWQKTSEENKNKLQSIGVFSPERKNRITGVKLPSISLGVNSSDDDNDDDNEKEGGIETPDGKKGFFGNVGESVKNITSKINPVDLSELGRAAFISRHNAGEDVNVQAPILEQGVELPTSVRGNLYLKNIFDKRAQDVLRSGNAMVSADPTLNRLTQLSLLKQAGEIQGEGAIRDAEALDRSLARQEEMQQSYADRRSDIANRNIQSLAAKAEAERQLKNARRTSVVQPYEDLWMQKNLELKQKQAMLKDFKTKANIAKLQGKYSKDIGENQAVIDKYAGRRDLNPSEQEAFNKAYRNMNDLQSRISEETMNIYANPDDFEDNTEVVRKPAVSSKGFTFMPTRKDGGKVADRALEEYKEKMKTSRERERMYNRIISEKYKENRLAESKARDRIHEIIKMAIK